MQACAVGQWAVLNAAYRARFTYLARQGIAQQCPERGIDEETLEVRAVEVTGGDPLRGADVSAISAMTHTLTRFLTSTVSNLTTALTVATLL